MLTLPFPTIALPLAGFTLAHSAWSVSEADDDELLCPLAVTERPDGQRALLRFEAQSQAEAIALGKRAMADRDAATVAWAFAREGSWRPETEQRPQDVFTVEFWAEGMTTPAMVLQPFQRRTVSGRFRVVGQPLLALDGRILASFPRTEALALHAGILSHGKVAPLWPGWQSAGDDRDRDV